MSGQVVDPVFPELENRLALCAIVLRATELEIALQTAMGVDCTEMAALSADLACEIDKLADQWMSRNGFTTAQIFESLNP